MKALILMLLPALMLIGCGQMDSNSGNAGDVLQQLSDNDAITEADRNSVSEELMGETVELTEMENPSSILMKVGGAELLIDFIEALTGDPDEVAMVINGVEISAGMLQDPQSFLPVIASIVSSQLNGVDIMGLPIADLVQMGLGLVTGDTDTLDFSNLVGTLVRGAMNMFLSGTPYGALFGAIAGPILDGITGGDNNTGDAAANDNPLGGIFDAIGGALGGGNNSNNNNNNQSGSVISGVFNLITNLIQ